MDNVTTSSSANPKAFEFIWTKDFSYLTINKVITKLLLQEDSLVGEAKSYILGIIPRKPRKISLPLSNISKVEVKKKYNIWDILFGIVFLAVGFASPIFFLVAALFFWCARAKSIVITTNISTQVEILSNSSSAAQEFIDFLNSKTIK